MAAHARTGMLLGLAILSGCSAQFETKHEAAAEPPLAKLIAGLDGDGRPLNLTEFRGQVVLLDFWRTG